MQIFFLFVTLQYLINQSFAGTRNKSIAPQAIASILEYLSRQSRTVDIITYGTEYEASNNFIGSILLRVNFSSAVRILDGCRRNPLILNTSSILIFDSKENFMRFATTISWQNDENFRRKHLVSVANLTIVDLRAIPTTVWPLFNSVNFLVNGNDKSIDVAQNIIFSAHACREGLVTVFNRFDRGTRRWHRTDLYPNKYQNLHGCPLFVAVIANITHSAVKQMIEVLSTSRNFTIQRLAYKRNRDNNVPFTFDFIEQFIEYGVTATPSIPIVFAQVYFVIPPGEPFDQLEKMFMMFEVEVWLAIFFTFSIALCTILIISLMSQSVKNLVYGSNFTSPAMNLISTFLIGAQHQVPRNSFARYLLILFIIFSLIIRTCHQSLLFKLLQADLRKPRIQSLEELQEKNFTFIGPMPLETLNVEIKSEGRI